MKKIIVVLVAVFCVAALAQAVPLTASWVEGEVSAKVGSSWKDLDIGDKIDSSALVKVGAGAFAEFTSGSRKLSLSSEGTYNLDTLLASSSAQAQKRSGVVDKMGKMVANKSPRSTVVGGVRGNFEGAPEKGTWVVDDDDPSVLAEEAQTLVNDRRFSDAAAKYAKAAEGSLADKRDEYLYAQAWCLASDEKTIPALKILRPMSSKGQYAIPRAILLARLNLDTGAAKEAAFVLDEISKNEKLVGDDAAMVKELREEARQMLAKK